MAGALAAGEETEENDQVYNASENDEVLRTRFELKEGIRERSSVP